jgi:hypothetical protein
MSFNEKLNQADRYNREQKDKAAREEEVQQQRNLAEQERLKQLQELFISEVREKILPILESVKQHVGKGEITASIYGSSPASTYTLELVWDFSGSYSNNSKHIIAISINQQRRNIRLSAGSSASISTPYEPLKGLARLSGHKKVNYSVGMRETDSRLFLTEASYKQAIEEFILWAFANGQTFGMFDNNP